MASSRAAGKAFGNIAETVCSLEFLTDITLLEKTSAGKGGGAGAPPHPSSMSILTQPFVRGGRADLKIADIHLTKGGVAYARGRFLTCLNTRDEEGLQRQLSQAPKS